jgi:hypothetical protein
MQVGDRIVSVNGIPMAGESHVRIMSILTTAQEVGLQYFSWFFQKYSPSSWV